METTSASIIHLPATGDPRRATGAIDDTVVLGPWVEVRLESGPYGSRRIVAVNRSNGFVLDLDDPATPWACRRDLVRLLSDHGFIAR